MPADRPPGEGSLERTADPTTTDPEARARYLLAEIPFRKRLERKARESDEAYARLTGKRPRE